MEPERRADLHTHTTASDGFLAPAELVRAAARAGLAAVAICDHDTLDGLAAAAAAAPAVGIEVVPGVEINTDAGGAEIHVLGYYVRGGGALGELLEQLRQTRVARAREMVDRLRAAGCDVTWERVARIAGAGSVGRPHVARALVEGGYAHTVRDAFEYFLRPGKPGYVPRHKLLPEDAVAAIAAAGGVPVLAHPGLIPLDLSPLLARLVAAGLRGVEVYYPEHAGETVGRLRQLARRHGLVETGGSDFHGAGVHKAPLGACAVPLSVVRALAALAR